MEFETLLKESMSDFFHNPNKIIEAEVLYVDRHKVLVDVGLHTEGIILRTEFIDVPRKGDKIKVVVESLDDGEGQLKITHKEIMIREQCERIPELVEKNEIIEVKVIAFTKSGLNIQYGYLGGFIPRKLVDIVPVANFAPLVNQFVKAKVLSFDSTHENLVVSRKAAIIDERGGIIPSLDRELEIGEVVEGKIINIKRYGLFVDIGGVSSLLHISDLCWNYGDVTPESFNIGDRINVVVKNKDSAINRYYLSLKHSDMNPWQLARAELKVGKKTKATVVKVEDNGDVIVSVHGVSGLIKTTDISWTRMTTSSVNAEFRRGAEIDVKVLGFVDDYGLEVVNVSRKGCVENPWDKVKTSISEGSVIEALVKSIGDKMIFINVFQDIDAIVPIKELSWTNPQAAIAKLAVGDRVKAKIIAVDAEDRRIAASIRQLQKSPFNGMKKGIKVTAKIESITKSGDLKVVCATHNGQQQGVILARNAVPSRSYKTDELYEIGQDVDCVVMNILSSGVINLSIKKDWSQQHEMKNNSLKVAMLAAYKPQ